MIVRTANNVAAGEFPRQYDKVGGDGPEHKLGYGSFAICRFTAVCIGMRCNGERLNFVAEHFSKNGND